MSELPTYDAIVSKDWRVFGDEKAKGPTRWSIREEVSSSRTQHISATVEQLLPQIQQRARQGLSKTEIVLIPSGQDAAMRGQLVDIRAGGSALFIQLEDAQNGTNFWTQSIALEELRRQLLNMLTDELDHTPVEIASTDPVAIPIQTPRSKSWFGRKSTSTVPAVVPAVVKPEPVILRVVLDDIHFRSETPYGLFETRSAKAVFIAITVT